MAKELVTIFGYGRFGRLLADILSNQFEVQTHDPYLKDQSIKNSTVVSLEEALKASTLFYAVPIHSLESTVSEHIDFLKSSSTDSHEEKTFIDVLSVKMLPKSIFEQYLLPHHRALLTHPMFGPDSVNKVGLSNQPIVLSPFQDDTEILERWSDIFSQLSLNTIQMTAEEHDRLAANSQGLTHFIGRVLEEFGIENSSIDTLGTKQLLEIKDQTCNDSWELFSGLQNRNPFTLDMRVKLGDALEKIYAKLLPKQADSKTLVVGIQGGKGSFNEEAAQHYLEEKNIQNFRIEYLYTTPNVLSALHKGIIDAGLFAVHNSEGGIVEESMLAMADYRFFIREHFSIKIDHTLMIKKGTKFEEIEALMSHPQVLKQCKKNLAEKYPDLKLTSGEGDLIDSSKVAEAISTGALPATYAAMGSKILADIYNLDIVAEHMQDRDENLTGFLWVERPFYE